MKEISDFNHKLSTERKITTITVGVLLLCGAIASIPLFVDSIKYPEVLFCNASSECRGSSVKHGVAYLVDRERRNELFDDNISIIKYLEPEDGNAAIFGLVSSCSLISAYAVSKNLTDRQERSIHSQFKLLKLKALENDLLERSHIDLLDFSRHSQNEITKQAIARQSAQTIEEMKSPGERSLDHLNGRLQGELSAKQHELHVSELDKEIASNRLTVAEANRKLDKMNRPDTAKKVNVDEQPKLTLIEALKSHEDGWLWRVVSSLKPLWISGNQGSGKTWTAAAIALVRKYCLDAPIYYLIDRHATGDNTEVWQYLQSSVKAETEDEIALAFEDCCNRWLSRIKGKVATKEQVVVDEFTNLQSLINESAVSFFKSSLTDTRKAKIFLLGITHNTSNESFPPGTAATRKAGSILIEKFSADGEKPLARTVIRYGLTDEKGNNLEDTERTFPCWFTPQEIHQHFTGRTIEFK